MITITTDPAAAGCIDVKHPLDLTEIPGGATTQWWSSGWELAEWPDGRRELRRIT
jgi:hypothetical protein